MSVPSTTKSWIVDGKNGFDSLKFEESKQIPKLGDDQVLVRGKERPKSSPQTIVDLYCP